MRMCCLFVPHRYQLSISSPLTVTSWLLCILNFNDVPLPWCSSVQCFVVALLVLSGLCAPCYTCTYVPCVLHATHVHVCSMLHMYSTYHVCSMLHMYSTYHVCSMLHMCSTYHVCSMLHMYIPCMLHATHVLVCSMLHMCHGAGAKVGWIKEYHGLTSTM